MKTSASKPLSGVTWGYDGPISIFRGKAYDGKGVSRTMFLKPERLEDIPEELFMIKISQSKKPELAGRPVFRFLSYKLTEDGNFETGAPETFTPVTPLAQIKQEVIAKFGQLPNVEISLSIPLKGKFTPVTFADDTFNIYDEKAFPSDDLELLGEPPYYLKQDVIMHVELKGVTSTHGNEYFQSTLSTTATSNDALQKKGSAGKIWSPDGDHAAAGVAEVTADTPKSDRLW